MKNCIKIKCHPRSTSALYFLPHYQQWRTPTTAQLNLLPRNNWNNLACKWWHDSTMDLSTYPIPYCSSATSEQGSQCATSERGSQWCAKRSFEWRFEWKSHRRRNPQEQPLNAHKNVDHEEITFPQVHPLYFIMLSQWMGFLYLHTMMQGKSLAIILLRRAIDEQEKGVDLGKPSPRD